MSERQLIAQDIAQDLNQLECAIDAAIAAAGGFVGRLPAYRLEADISAVCGQEVFTALCDATAQLALARGSVVRGHQKLEALRRAMHLNPVTSTGPIDKPGVTPAGVEPAVGFVVV